MLLFFYTCDIDLGKLLIILFFPAHTFAAKCHCDDFRNCDGSMWETPSKCTVRNAFGATAQSVVSGYICSVFTI